MEPNTRLRSAVRVFYGWLLATVLLAVGPIVGENLIDGGTLGQRIAGVAIAIAVWIPWIIIVVDIIRHGDEFSRRVHLVGLALGFIGVMVSLASLDWLVRAEFIPQPPLAFVWPAGLVMWLVGILAANHYYQRPS